MEAYTYASQTIKVHSKRCTLKDALNREWSAGVPLSSVALSDPSIFLFLVTGCMDRSWCGVVVVV